MSDKKNDKKPVKVQDLSPKKDAKGGRGSIAQGAGHAQSGGQLNRGGAAQSGVQANRGGAASKGNTGF